MTPADIPKTLHPKTHTATASRPGILLVEDHHHTSETLTKHLRIFGGYEVYPAKTVQEARSLAKQYPTVRFIFLDMDLPNEDQQDDPSLSGIVLLREFSELLPKAKIYMKSQTPPPPAVSDFIRTYNSVIRIGSGYDALEVKRYADIIYSDGKMRPKIFIVHGHDNFMMDELASFIRDKLRIGEPVIIKNEAEKGRAVIEKFEDHARYADLVFALITPDDAVGVGRRARQNVIFEIGYFAAAMGRKSGKLIVLSRNDVEIPSDMAGLLTIDISNGILAAGDRICAELKGWWGMDSAVNG